MVIRDEVKQFVMNNLLFGQADGLDEQDSFLDRGIIDSTGVLELINFIEDHFGVRVQDSDLVPENLDSIQRVSRFVEIKLSETVE